MTFILATSNASQSTRQLEECNLKKFYLLEIQGHLDSVMHTQIYSRSYLVKKVCAYTILDNTRFGLIHGAYHGIDSCISKCM